MNIQWYVKAFSQLSPEELYAVLQLRNEVFVVEQNCVFQDADNKDQVAFHFMGWHQNHLVAYTRLLAPGISYNEASIGRVVTAPLVRRAGIGKELMQRSIETLFELFGRQPIQIGAQLYLQRFYESFGFVQIGEGYLEDGIPHIHMLKK
jgi:ElaA protein